MINSTGEHYFLLCCIYKDIMIFNISTSNRFSCVSTFLGEDQDKRLSLIVEFLGLSLSN